MVSILKTATALFQAVLLPGLRFSPGCRPGKTGCWGTAVLPENMNFRCLRCCAIWATTRSELGKCTGFRRKHFMDFMVRLWMKADASNQKVLSVITATGLS